jgi:hypothetical protein
MGQYSSSETERVMYLPWPIRPMLEYSRRKRTLRAALKEVGTCSDAMGPVKSALARAVRGPSLNERREFAAIDQRWIALSKRSRDPAHTFVSFLM